MLQPDTATAYLWTDVDIFRTLCGLRKLPLVATACAATMCHCVYSFLLNIKGRQLFLLPASILCKNLCFVNAVKVYGFHIRFLCNFFCPATCACGVVDEHIIFCCHVFVRDVRNEFIFFLFHVLHHPFCDYIIAFFWAKVNLFFEFFFVFPRIGAPLDSRPQALHLIRPACRSDCRRAPSDFAAAAHPALLAIRFLLALSTFVSACLFLFVSLGMLSMEHWCFVLSLQG